VAAPPGSRAPALRAAVAAGTVLAGRYRLTEPLPAAADDPDDATRWAAVDDVLDRPVAVLLLLAGGRRAPAGRSLLEAAAAAGTVASPVPAQVYDAALEAVPAERYGKPAGDVDVAFVVSEAVRGRTLTEVLTADGPLEPAEAVALVTRAAQGLAAAHRRGVAHGSVHPGTLVLGEEGARCSTPRWAPRSTASSAASAAPHPPSPPTTSGRWSGASTPR
jgi:serine/threonine protein kinase